MLTPYRQLHRVVLLFTLVRQAACEEDDTCAECMTDAEADCTSTGTDCAAMATDMCCMYGTDCSANTLLLAYASEYKQRYLGPSDGGLNLRRL